MIDQVKLVEDSVKAGLIPDYRRDIKRHKSAVKAAEEGLIVLIKAGR